MRKVLRGCYSGALTGRIDAGHWLHDRLSGRVVRHEETRTCLAVLKGRAEHLGGTMAAMGLYRLCAECGSGPGGGCCSAEMANEADAILLWMNELADRRPEAVRDDGLECCFLGDAGCSLLFKPMFCLNYNCTGIRKGAGASGLRRLEREAGRLLQAQYAMELLLHDILGGLRSAEISSLQSFFSF